MDPISAPSQGCPCPRCVWGIKGALFDVTTTDLLEQAIAAALARVDLKIEPDGKGNYAVEGPHGRHGSIRIDLSTPE